MALRLNATLHMPDVAKAMNLPTGTVRRGLFLSDEAATIFLASPAYLAMGFSA